MPSLGSIFVDLLMNDANFTQGSKRAGKAVNDFQKEIKGASGFVTGLAAALTTGAFGVFVANALHAADETNKMARSLGIATENFQALNLVADEAGVQTENLANLIGKAQKTIVAAAQGGSTKAFDAIGVSIKDIINLRPDEQFEALAVGLSKIENPTTRNALAMQIFGKSGRDVVNMLEDFSAKVEEAREFNDKFNITLNDIDGRKIEEANDTFARLGKAVGGLGNTIAVQLAPVITGLSNELLNAGVNGQNFSDSVSSGMKVIGFAVDAARVSFMGLDGAIQTIQLLLVELGKTALDVIANVTAVPLSIAGIFSDTAKEAQQAIADAQKFAGDTSDVIKQRLSNLNSEFANFQTTAEKIAKYQADAQQRAEAAKKAGAPGSLSPDLASDAAEQQKKLAALYEKNRTYIERIDKATLQYQDTLKELKKLLDGNIITYQQYNDAIGNLNKEFENAQAKSKDFFDDTSDFARRASENIQDSLADFIFDPFAKGREGMLKGWVDTLRKMAAQAAATNFAKLLFGDTSNGASKGGGLLSGLFDGLGSIFNGGGIGLGDIQWNGPRVAGFADGGQIQAGKWGIVGEEGPEWAYGGSVGMSVIPPGKAGSAGGNNYNIDARGADQGAVARIEKALLALAGPGVIEKRVTNAQQRGAL